MQHIQVINKPTFVYDFNDVMSTLFALERKTFFFNAVMMFFGVSVFEGNGLGNNNTNTTNYN